MTKKCLVAFDPDKPQAKSSDFLCPVVNDGNLSLFGLKTKKVHEMGMVVYTGKDLSPNDVFARLVDTGRKITSVDNVLKTISDYLEALRIQRIGDVVTIGRKDGRIVLLKTDIRPAIRRGVLP